LESNQTNDSQINLNFRINTKTIRAASFLLGLGLIVWLILSTGVRSILNDLSRVGAGVILIFALELVADACNTLGWQYTLPANERRGTYCRMFLVRAAGNAINESTPAASLGGEPAKVILLRGWVSTSAATASLLLTKVPYCLADTTFIMAGSALVWTRITLPPDITLALLIGFSLMLTGILTFAFLQIRGMGASALRFLRRLRIPESWLGKLEPFSNEIDSHLSDFYRQRRGDLLRAIGSHLCGFGVNGLQMLLMLQWLKLGLDPIAALGIAAFLALFALVGFAVPASLGVLEGGAVLIFWALGLPENAAMATALTLRLVLLSRIALGLVVFMLLRHKQVASQ
jgi:uncharacterized protein (TIRG00374 family)